MCIRDSPDAVRGAKELLNHLFNPGAADQFAKERQVIRRLAVSYTHLRAHETVLDLVCRLLLEQKNNTNYTYNLHRIP